MDDLLSGSSSVREATKICKEITDVLPAHGFPLWKWKLNSKQFLTEFKDYNTPSSDIAIIPNDNESL